MLLFIIDGATRVSLYDLACAGNLGPLEGSSLRFGARARSLPYPRRSTPPSRQARRLRAASSITIRALAPTATRRRCFNRFRNRTGVARRGFDWYKQMFGRRALYIPAECCERDDPAEVARAVESMIGHNDLPFFTVAHFLSPDNAAHATGSNTGELYRSSIRTIDSLLGGIFRLLDRTLPGALVIVVSDHGMNVDGNHGGTDDASMRVPLYLLSPSLPHASVSRTVYHAAIAPTVAAAAGAALPALSGPVGRSTNSGAPPEVDHFADTSFRLPLHHPSSARLAAPGQYSNDARPPAPSGATRALQGNPAPVSWLFFSLALLLLAAMVMRGQTPVPEPAPRNGTVVAAARVAMRVISSAYIHSVAVGCTPNRRHRGALCLTPEGLSIWATDSRLVPPPVRAPAPRNRHHRRVLPAGLHLRSR